MGKGRIATRKSHILKHASSPASSKSRPAHADMGLFSGPEVHTEFQSEGKL